MADQCCTMRTGLTPGCNCGDDCDCMCTDCACEGWGEEHDDG